MPVSPSLSFSSSSEQLPLNLNLKEQTPAPEPAPTSATVTFTVNFYGPDAKDLVLDQTIFDIFVTALEGGIDYWVDAVTYRPYMEDKDTDGEPVENTFDFWANVKFTGIKEDGSASVERIDRGTIIKGLLKLANAPEGLDHKQTALLILLGAPDTDYDADFADAVVQMGLFGEQVFA